jgi:hypothetical protein
METWNVVEAIAESLSALAAAVAIFMTVVLHRKQMQLEERQMLLEQRQLLVPLWEQLKEVNDIDPEEPIWMDVIQAVNILDLLHNNSVDSFSRDIPAISV